MSIVYFIFIYLLIWWLVIFAVLPWGVKTEKRPKRGHAESAPVNPDIWRKVLITSIISFIITGIITLIFEHVDVYKILELE